MGFPEQQRRRGGHTSELEAVNMPIRAIIDRPPEGKRPDSDDPKVVVPKGPDGKRLKNGGWTEPVEGEDYKPIIEAWRKQDPQAGSAINNADTPKKKGK